MAVEMWSSWLSPGAAWFVFINVVVGAIAVMSWLGHAATPSSARRRLARTASTVIMERLRSIANFPFQYTDADYYCVTPRHGTAVSESDYFCGSREAGEVEEEARANRVVVVENEPKAAAPDGESGTPTTTKVLPSVPVSSEAAATTVESEEEDESISLDEAYALARQAHAPHSPQDATSATDPVATPTKREPAAKVADADRRARAEEILEGKSEVNARAERFIQQFREDLKLQRINSIINYTNALRRRGGCAAPAQAPAR
ncbi:hypothetical protein GUJ93_ZPchr0008g11909 [Zizania palustris]|uniref:DUF4408 domain-containing protein n=1 Tax=Zizania palustris TaxID=103762 RepID=A0A8J5V4M5_ZIZPA|nr:hypothetical protein GUJ93_ZPchr0008g11909 [Zizania palustris]